jgi:hypothetical protein
MVLVVDDRVKARAPVVVNWPAAMVVSAAAPFTWIVAVAVAELVVLYAAAAVKMPA